MPFMMSTGGLIIVETLFNTNKYSTTRINIKRRNILNGKEEKERTPNTPVSVNKLGMVFRVPAYLENKSA